VLTARVTPPKPAKSAAAWANDAVQFNIGIQFPNCWDGVNLKPAHGLINATYDVKAMPVHLPVKIPTVNMNIAYVLPTITSLDTSEVQLSWTPSCTAMSAKSAGEVSIRRMQIS
jgi:hypothetical protein